MSRAQSPSASQAQTRVGSPDHPRSDGKAEARHLTARASSPPGSAKRAFADDDESEEANKRLRVEEEPKLVDVRASA